MKLAQRFDRNNKRQNDCFSTAKTLRKNNILFPRVLLSMYRYWILTNSIFRRSNVHTIFSHKRIPNLYFHVQREFRVIGQEATTAGGLSSRYQGTFASSGIAQARTIEIDFGGISVHENWPILVYRPHIDPNNLRSIKDFRGYVSARENSFFLPLLHWIFLSRHLVGQTLRHGFPFAYDGSITSWKLRR